MVKKTSSAEVVEFNEIRSLVRAGLEKRYGSVAEFLKHKDSEKFGGRKIRCYLYDSGAKNFDVISRLCRYLGIGTMSREVKVIRTATYTLCKAK